MSISDAYQQLDYVFATSGFHESVTARGLDSVDEWGSSDHCRPLIEVAGRRNHTVSDTRPVSR